jgi:hypothetical protein
MHDDDESSQYVGQSYLQNEGILLNILTCMNQLNPVSILPDGALK